MILAVFLSLAAKCQLGWEDFYSEKDFRQMFQQARNPKEKIYALGLLASKGLSKDSIIKEIYAVADKADEKQLKATALWWDALLNDNDTTRIIKLLQFAEQAQLVPFQIAANLLLADHYIHDMSGSPIVCARTAESLLQNLQGSKKQTDSLRIEVFRRIAHAYVHKGDAINTARYLLPLRNYAERSKAEETRAQAMEVLSDMYFEGDKSRGIQWAKKLHEYFKKTIQVQKYTGQTYNLALTYSWLYVDDSVPDYKTKAIYYFKELDKLIDSLNVAGGFLYWVLFLKFDIGLLDGEEVIALVDNNYNSHYQFSPPENRNLKLKIYFATGQFDSLKTYISKIPKSPFYDFWMKDYYLKKGDFEKAIPILKSFQENAEPKHSFSDLQWIYNDLVKAYVGKRDYKLAYEYKLKALQTKDSLDKLKGKEQVASMEMQKQVELQQAAFDDEQAKLSFRNRMRLYGLIAGLAGLLVVISILWKNNQRKQRDKLKIESAYNDLKLTQQQLIQSEKMASLGELTAGIAHEIQNPLNFINNFSDVNRELLEELKIEARKISNNEILTIADDVINNEEKINHHGKRADAIVKGMLQHSRTSSGQRELTDIHVLAEEYLRLAYHGLRAKDKSFNATIKTDLDINIGRVNIIPQDIGRVLLNLINNAFYAVAEKKKQQPIGYEPSVSLTTKKVNGKVEIAVKDNGNGIPQKVVDKIFQPFFTTKPAGQGTGLGLSLAYDIVKAHGGKIKVETNEGEGSEFIIELLNS